MDSIIILMIGIGISVILTARENAKKRQDLFEKKSESSKKVEYEKTSTQPKTRPKRTFEELSKKQADFIELEVPLADFHIETVEHDTDVYYEPTKVSYEEDKELTKLKQVNQNKTKRANKKKVDKTVAKTPSKTRNNMKEKKVSISTSQKINLKQAYIWKEILDKPMALREEELW